MANHKSAKKRIIRNAKASELNSARKSAIRTAVRKVEHALQSGDAAEAKKALIAAKPQMARGAAKKVMDKKAVSRKISRLSSRIKALDTKA